MSRQGEMPNPGEWIDNTIENASIQPPLGAQVEVIMRDGQEEPDIYAGEVIRPRKLWVSLPDYYPEIYEGGFIADENAIDKWRLKP